MSNNVSIILCFYNAENKLDKTLNAIKKLSVPGDTLVELILVNNNSSDQSQHIIKNVMGSFNKFPVRIVEEKTPGLAFARKNGISVSSHDLILFCDDDNWFAQDYLELGTQILIQNKNIGVLGGCGSAVSDVPIPSWFDAVQNYYAVGPQMPQTGEVKGIRNVVYGAGMWVRKSAYLKITSEGFDFFTLGRTGAKLSSGEDSELCLALRIAGYKIWYSSDLTFKHYIEPKRLTDRYFKSLKKGMAGSRFVTRFYLDFLNGYSPVVNDSFWIKELAYNTKDTIVNLFTGKIDGLVRNFQFTIYLLREKKNYNRNVQKIVSLCLKLKASK